MDRVQISLTVTHTMDGQTETTHMEYGGKATEKGSGWFISYTEQMEGAGDVATIVKIAEADVTLIRQGKLQMKQSFVRGQSTGSPYDTPHGRFFMQVHTQTLRIERERGRPVSVQLDYQMWLDERYLGEYRLVLGLIWT